MKTLCASRHGVVLLVLLACLSVGCVRKSTYDELVAKGEDLEAKLQKERAEKESILAELQSRKMKSIELLETKLGACEERILQEKAYAKKAEEAGYYRGASDLNRSIQVKGVPSSDGFWLFADNYYRFEVWIAGNPAYTVTVETDEAEPPLVEGVKMVARLSKALTFRSVL